MRTRPAMLEVGVLLPLVLGLQLQLAMPSPVTITAVTPSRGSLAGGTRLMIRGSGFSNNVGGGCYRSPATS